ncbi:MAG: hypothetical protein AAF236_07730 [Verrucomicrobiota bacterium]
MTAEALKAQIDELSEEELKELSLYLTKMRLEHDPEYWAKLRRNADQKHLSDYRSLDVI